MVKKQRTLLDTIRRFIGFKITEIGLFALVIIIFRYIGYWFIGLIMGHEYSCAIKEVGVKFSCDSYFEVIFMGWILQGILGFMLSILIIVLIIGFIYFIKWNWEKAKEI